MSSTNVKSSLLRNDSISSAGSFGGTHARSVSETAETMNRKETRIMDTVPEHSEQHKLSIVLDGVHNESMRMLIRFTDKLSVFIIVAFTVIGIASGGATALGFLGLFGGECMFRKDRKESIHQHLAKVSQLFILRRPVMLYTAECSLSELHVCFFIFRFNSDPFALIKILSDLGLGNCGVDTVWFAVGSIRSVQIWDFGRVCRSLSISKPTI